MKEERVTLPNDLEMTPELCGLSTNMISGALGSSASRGQMEGGQRAQTLVLNYPDNPLIYVGVEQEMAKYTFAPRLDFNAEVIASIDKYHAGLSRDSFQLNPHVGLIVKNIQERKPVYDYIDVPIYISYHNNFGYMLWKTDDYQKIRRPGAHIMSGDVLAESPGVNKEGMYRYGRLTNVCYLTSTYVTEDGFWAADEWCEESIATGIGSITVTVPKNHYLLHIYGTKENPRFFPTLGEKIRPDGMVLASREHDPILALYQLTPEGMTEVDYATDEPKFIEGSCRNATVIDIDIVLNEQEMSQVQPVILDEDGNEIPNQLVQIWEERKRACNDLIDVAEEIYRQHPGETPRFSGRFTFEVDRALHMTERRHIYTKQKPKSIRFLHHGVPIPMCQIKITYKYDIIPEIGSKISGDFGDKGVICRKSPRADMPHDMYGIYADLVAHANATINRMIPIRLDNHYLGAQSILMELKIKKLWDEGRWQEAFDYVSEIYSVVCPRAKAESFDRFMTTNERKKNHIRAIVEDHIMFEIAQNDTPNYVRLTEALENRWPYKKGVVSFRSTRGTMKKTKVPVMIGRAYIRVLEKTGHDWGAVDSPTRQAHGVAAKIGHRDRNGRPWRKQPYRYGEAEIRSIAGIAGGEFASDLLDRANNPVVQEVINENIMNSEKPTDLYEAVDRKKYPIGQSVTHQYLNNALYVMGAHFVRKHTDKKGSKD